MGNCCCYPSHFTLGPGTTPYYWMRGSEALQSVRVSGAIVVRETYASDLQGKKHSWQRKEVAGNALMEPEFGRIGASTVAC